MKTRLIIIYLALIAFVGFTGTANAVEKNLPFYAGEKLTFAIKWVFIPAGEVVFQVLPVETMNGLKLYHFMMTARTYPYIDPFYKVRDRIDAYTDAEMSHSVLYKKRAEGKHRRDVIVSFDWEKQEAQYSNFGEKRDPISIMPGSFDPLSIFYAFRLQDLRENEVIEKPVTDGKKCIIGKAKVIKREKIKIADRTYDTYLLEPELEQIGGIFKKSKNAKLKLWVTADKKRFPVKVKSKLAVGSFIGELVSVERTDLDTKNFTPTLEKGPDSPESEL